MKERGMGMDLKSLRTNVRMAEFIFEIMSKNIYIIFFLFQNINFDLLETGQINQICR